MNNQLLRLKQQNSAEIRRTKGVDYFNSFSGETVAWKIESFEPKLSPVAVQRVMLAVRRQYLSVSKVGSSLDWSPDLFIACDKAIQKETRRLSWRLKILFSKS
jgi:hypothetical protein